MAQPGAIAHKCANRVSVKASGPGLIRRPSALRVLGNAGKQAFRARPPVEEAGMPFVHALLYLFNSLISLIIFVVIVNAVISWLVAFDVVNLRNPTAYRIVRTLDAITAPMLAPIRRFMPNLGGVDISPIILLLLLQALRILVNDLLAPYAVSAAVYG